MMKRMKRFRGIVLRLFSICLVGSCSNGSYMLEPIEVIANFENKRSLAIDDAVVLDVKGLVDIKSHRGYVFCLTMDPSGIIVGFDNSSPAERHSFLKIGNGPYELLGPVPFHTMAFYEVGEEVLADIYNMKGTVIRINLTQSARKEATIGVAEKNLTPDLVGLGPLTCLGEDFYFFEHPSQDSRQVTRGLWQNGEMVFTKAQEKLNKATLEKTDGVLFNLLMTSVGYEPGLGRFIEASSMLNTIYLYDDSSSFTKTISIGGRPDSYLEKTKDGVEGLTRTSLNLQVFPSFFTVLYSGDSLYHPTGKKPSLLFFSLDGSPLFEIDLPVNASSFDIDISHRKLYLVNQESEQLTIINIDDVLSEIEQLLHRIDS